MHFESWIRIVYVLIKKWASLTYKHTWKIITKPAVRAISSSNYQKCLQAVQLNHCRDFVWQEMYFILFHLMACRILGANSLIEPTLTYHQLDTEEVFIQENIWKCVACKMSTILFEPLRVNVLTALLKLRTRNNQGEGWSNQKQVVYTQQNRFSVHTYSCQITFR